jgi:hypothetical protein
MHSGVVTSGGFSQIETYPLWIIHSEIDEVRHQTCETQPNSGHRTRGYAAATPVYKTEVLEFALEGFPTRS